MKDADRAIIQDDLDIQMYCDAHRLQIVDACLCLWRGTLYGTRWGERGHSDARDSLVGGQTDCWAQ